MGSKIFRPVKKIFKKVTKFVDKKIVEPIERPVKKVVKGVKNVTDEIIEEIIEKPVKKIGTETIDFVTGMDKNDRRPPPEPEITPEVTPESDEVASTIVGRGKRRTKRSGQAGTIMEEYGVMTAKAKAKAVEKA